MEESYETFERELGRPRVEPAPQKPLRQVRRPEMYTSRKMKEETASVLQPEPVPKIQPRETSFTRSMSLRKTISIQNLTQIDTPWENVTLNRCLFVAIAILVLTSGFQRLHESLRGQRTREEEEVQLTVKHPGALRHRVKPSEPQTSLWEVVSWWLPDIDDDDDEEEDESETRKGGSKRRATDRAGRGLRNRPPPETLTRQRDSSLKDRRTKKTTESKKKVRGKNISLDEGEKETTHEEEEEAEEHIILMKKKEKTKVNKA